VRCVCSVFAVCLQYVAVCCSVARCAAVCCSVLQCVAVCCSVARCAAVCCSVLQFVAVRCSVLQCGTVCCSDTVAETNTNPLASGFWVSCSWGLILFKHEISKEAYSCDSLAEVMKIAFGPLLNHHQKGVWSQINFLYVHHLVYNQ